jgi:p70 ribosomal S6 kinase
VFQVRKKDSGEIFAMKVMRKEKILSKNQSEYCRQVLIGASPAP